MSSGDIGIMLGIAALASLLGHVLFTLAARLLAKSHRVAEKPPLADLVAIMQQLCVLNGDELRGVAHMVRKIRVGALKHGHLVLATDRRNWTKERRAEYQDALWYRTFQEICEEDGQ